MAQLFETLMLICFGCSWPISVVKSYRARTAKGKSVAFTYAIIVGYICGILGKITGDNVSYVLALYILNLAIVLVDLALYYRNRKLDAREDLQRAEEDMELEALEETVESLS